MAVKETARIARRNQRITFQKRTVVVDKYKNHTSTWEDYFTCSAYASTYEATEDESAVTTEERSVTFEVRFCPELSSVTSTGFQIVFHGDEYNIESVDLMNYQYHTIRFLCRRNKRKETANG